MTFVDSNKLGTAIWLLLISFVLLESSKVGPAGNLPLILISRASSGPPGLLGRSRASSHMTVSHSSADGKQAPSAHMWKDPGGRDWYVHYVAKDITNMVREVLGYHLLKTSMGQCWPAAVHPCGLCELGLPDV